MSSNSLKHVEVCRSSAAASKPSTSGGLNDRVLGERVPTYRYAVRTAEKGVARLRYRLPTEVAHIYDQYARHPDSKVEGYASVIASVVVNDGGKVRATESLF